MPRKSFSLDPNVGRGGRGNGDTAGRCSIGILSDMATRVTTIGTQNEGLTLAFVSAVNHKGDKSIQ